MSKTKSTTKAAKPSKDVLTKVKDAGVKGAKDTKSKNKEVAKKVAEKEEKKSKKSNKAKDPTPEPSSAEEESSESSSSDESEVEVKTKKVVSNGKANGTKKAAAKDESSASEAESSDESESSEDEAPAPKKAVEKKGAEKKPNGVKAAAKKEESSDESESDSSDDEATTAPATGVLGKAPAVDEADSSDESDSSEDDDEAKPKATGAKKAESSDEDDDESSDDSSEDEEEEVPAVNTNKRKAEEQPERALKKAKAEGAEAEDAGSKNLFIGNLSWNVDDNWLRETFEEHGELTGVRIMIDRATNRSKGFGYVEFANAADAAAAYEAKKGFELDGRNLNVDWASAKPDNSNKMQDRRKSYGDQLSEPSDTLFVGNLSFDVGQEQVSEAFGEHGTIMSVRLPTDQETGSPKGFGYVTFSSIEEAQVALEAMSGAYIGSRPIRLDYSQPRPERQDGGFGGRGRGRGGDRGGFGGRGRGGDRGRGGFGGRGRGGDRGRGGRGSFGGRGGSTNRGGFGDFAGSKKSFD